MPGEVLALQLVYYSLKIDSIQQGAKGEWKQASISQSSHSAPCGRFPKEVNSSDVDLCFVFMDIGISSCEQSILTLKATQPHNKVVELLSTLSHVRRFSNQL